MLRTKNISLAFFQRLNKQPPFFSKFYPIYNQERKYLKPLSGNVCNFSIKQVHQYDKNQNHLNYLHEKLQLKYHKILNSILQKMKHHPDWNANM